MKKNVLIIGAGGVANVAAHKAAQNNDVLGDICIASRKLEKCDKIIESIHRKGNLKDKSKTQQTTHTQNQTPNQHTHHKTRTTIQPTLTCHSQHTLKAHTQQTHPKNM